MSPFILTQRVKADLKSIAIFTERRWGRDQRLAYNKQFDDTFYLLSNSPVIVNNCDYIKNGNQNPLKLATLFSIEQTKKIPFRLFLFSIKAWMYFQHSVTHNEVVENLKLVVLLTLLL